MAPSTADCLDILFESCELTETILYANENNTKVSIYQQHVDTLNILHSGSGACTNNLILTIFFLLLIFGGLRFERHNNHKILFYNHKNKNPDLKTSSYSHLETGQKPVLFCLYWGNLKLNWPLFVSLDL